MSAAGGGALAGGAAIPRDLAAAAAAEVAAEPHGGDVARPRRRLWVRGLRALWLWAVGAHLCMNPVTALLVVGWSYRLAQRVAVRRWRKSAGLPPDGQALLPNWVLADRFPEALGAARSGAFIQRARALGHALTGSLWPNLATGWKGFANSMVLTLPAGMLMMLSWHFGWDNSFNKGYEQAWAGPAAGVAGLVLLIAVMGHLVMAQARQAVTGRGLAFYHFWRVRKALWAAPLATFGLGLLYTLFGLGIIVSAAALIGINNSRPDLASASQEEVRQLLWVFYLSWCFALFPAFALLKAIGGRAYAGAVSRLLERGDWGRPDLTGEEAAALDAIEDARNRGTAEEPDAQRPGPAGAWRRFFRYSGGATWRWPLRVLAAVAIWFPFGAQVYIAEFLVHQPAVRFLRHPLVQIPWFHYVPLHLRENDQGGIGPSWSGAASGDAPPDATRDEVTRG